MCFSQATTKYINNVITYIFMQWRVKNPLKVYALYLSHEKLPLHFKMQFIFFILFN